MLLYTAPTSLFRELIIKVTLHCEMPVVWVASGYSQIPGGLSVQ